jgi:hypothetical protein
MQRTARLSAGTQEGPGQPAQGKAAGMGRVIKLILVLLVLGFVGLVGYSYLADLTPEPQEVTVPVILNAD